MTDSTPNPDADLVSVFETTEAGLLPVAQLALDEAGIEHSVQNRGFVDQLFGRRSSMTVGETDTPLHIVVRAEDEARARDVLRDLGSANAAAPADALATEPAAPAAGAPPRAPMGGDVEITDADSGAPLGFLTPEQFDSMAAHLELESTRDDDYYIDAATIAMLEAQQANPAVLALLRAALAGRTEMNIRWRR
jgi:processive 1,2-diacylglycerol beta-glucosyltransferase